MRVIRFHYNYGRAEIFLPRVKIYPGMEAWVEIQGLSNYSVEGINGQLNGNRFLLSQVEGDVFIIVDGVKHRIKKEELVPQIKIEEIIVPEFNYGSGSVIKEEIKAEVKEDIEGYIDTKFQNEGLYQIVEEKASQVVEELVADATEEDIRGIFSQSVIHNNEGL